MEYHYVSDKDYYFCKSIADEICDETASYFSKKKVDLRFQDVINFLTRYLGIKEVYLFNTENDSLVNHCIFKTLFTKHKINLKISDEKAIVKDIFCENVCGLTFFSEVGPIIFLNGTTTTFTRTIFTLIHELVHCYLAFKDEQYKEKLAYISEKVFAISTYTKEMQPTEDRTNVIASLIYINDVALRENIENLSWEEMRDKFGISKKALHTRLMNFFKYNFDFSKEEVKNAIWSFLYEKSEWSFYLNKMKNYELEMLNEIHKDVIADFDSEMATLVDLSDWFESEDDYKEMIF